MFFDHSTTLIRPQAFFRFLSPRFFNFSRAVFRVEPQLSERLEGGAVTKS